jgi:K+/H+ antiporter YhaU regulatory subunit KhtT
MYLLSQMTHDWLKNFNSQALDDSFRVVFTAKSSEKSTISYILGQSSFYSMHLSYFNKDMSKQYIEKFLGKYNKVCMQYEQNKSTLNKKKK